MNVSPSHFVWVFWGGVSSEYLLLSTATVADRSSGLVFLKSREAVHTAGKIPLMSSVYFWCLATVWLMKGGRTQRGYGSIGGEIRAKISLARVTPWRRTQAAWGLPHWRAKLREWNFRVPFVTQKSCQKWRIRLWVGRGGLGSTC